MPFVFFLVVVAAVIFLAILSNKKLKQRRGAMQVQIDAMRGQMQQLGQQSQNLDEKTRERVNMARAAVEMKLGQAAILLRTATHDRHFERIGRILALVQTKLDNVQASLARAQARADERVQRQAENAQRREAERAQRQADAAARRMGSFGPKGKPGYPRQGSFAPPVQVTNSNTAWNTIPLNERGACFFCSRPCTLRELTPVVVPLGGIDRRVLACPADYATVQSGTIPPIRAFSENGRPVPWYAYRRYNPYNDYYGEGADVYIDTFPYSMFDPGYWNFGGGYGYDEGPYYNFSPDTEAYQDFSSGMAAGAVLEGDGATWQSGGAGGADFQSVGGGDNVGGADFDGIESASDFASDAVGAASAGADFS